jgi:hypothetical protein
LPETIEEIEFGKTFNLELNNMPNSIKKIKFNDYSDYDKELNNLPNKLEILKLPSEYNLKIVNIPKTLKILICSIKYKFIDDFLGLEVICY